MFYIYHLSEWHFLFFCPQLYKARILHFPTCERGQYKGILFLVPQSLDFLLFWACFPGQCPLTFPKFLPLTDNSSTNTIDFQNPFPSLNPSLRICQNLHWEAQLNLITMYLIGGNHFPVWLSLGQALVSGPLSLWSLWHLVPLQWGQALLWVKYCCGSDSMVSWISPWVSN